VKRSIDLVLIVGFAILDWRRFHDILKPESLLESPTKTGL
jgi:hypothetical protein